MSETTKKLRTLSERATPGPWRAVDDRWMVEDEEANAALIAAMRNTIDALLDVAEAAEFMVAAQSDAVRFHYRRTLREALARLDADAGDAGDGAEVRERRLAALGFEDTSGQPGTVGDLLGLKKEQEP